MHYNRAVAAQGAEPVTTARIEPARLWSSAMNDDTGFAAITRIAAGDDGSNYDNVAIALHWATALLVVIQFSLAETWDWFAKPVTEFMENTHTSLGILLAALIAARLIWRWIPGHQLSPLDAGWVRFASMVGHYVLYLLLVAQAALGFTVGWAAGRPMHFFGLGIPGPFDAFPRPVRHDLREIHEWVGWAIIVTAALHAAAALYHHYVLKDGVLRRMLPGEPSRHR
jgi:cytochrome b561